MGLPRLEGFQRESVASLSEQQSFFSWITKESTIIQIIHSFLPKRKRSRIGLRQCSSNLPT